MWYFSEQAYTTHVSLDIEEWKDQMQDFKAVWQALSFCLLSYFLTLSCLGFWKREQGL